MADLNSAYEQELKKRLGSGLATPYSGARTKGGEIFEGIASGVQGLGELVQSTGLQYPKPLERLAMQIDGYLRKPSSGLSEQIEIDKDIASGIGRPREIQEQIDIFESVPGADPLTVEQINQLSRNQSEGRKSKPFPVEEAAKLKAENKTKRQIELYGSGAGDEAKAQDMIIAKRKEQELADANREASLDMPSMSDDPAEQLFAQAMTDYISQAREGAEGQLPKVGDIEAYKKKFAEATGVDISGKPDTSQALMAMGLSMMQNRAGKGFNVGRMLSSVGEAGEKALPALTKAKAEARANQVAAGKYALDMESKDETKREAARKEMSALGQYFVVPKGDGVAGTVSSILNNKGSFETFSKGELQQLMKNPEFAGKFDVLPGSSYTSILEEAMKTPEGKKLYIEKSRSENLIEGNTDPIFQVRVFDNNPNTNPDGRSRIAGDGSSQYRALARYAKDTQRAKERFIELGILTRENRNVFTYGIDKINSLSSVVGVQFTEDMDETSRIKMILERMQARNAPDILGESGKTISDGDRERVLQIVGDISATTDIRVLRKKVEELFTDIIVSREMDINQGLSTLNNYTGRNVGSALGDGELSEEERKTHAEDLKAMGLNRIYE
jgi:hypothetical protein